MIVVFVVSRCPASECWQCFLRTRSQPQLQLPAEPRSVSWSVLRSRRWPAHCHTLAPPSSCDHQQTWPIRDQYLCCINQSEISIMLYQPIRIEYLPNTSRYCFIIRDLPRYHTIRLEWNIFSDLVEIFLISPCRGSIVAEYQRPWERRGWWRGWWWRREWHCDQLVLLLINSLLRESPSWPGELRSSLTCPDPEHRLTVRTIS